MTYLKYSAPLLLAITAFLGCNGGNAAAPASPTPGPATDTTAGNDDPTTTRNVTFFDGEEGCPQTFDLMVVQQALGSQTAWSGDGRLVVDACPPPDADYDAFMSLRLPEFNRRLRVTAMETDNSTDSNRHYEGQRLIHRGDDNYGAMIRWTLNAHILNSSVAPMVRVEGSVVRDRTRWHPSPEEGGGLIEVHDTLSADFGGEPTADHEPNDCPDL
ncbi:MAG: hypothetical protein ABI743_02340 [bacterium]